MKFLFYYLFFLLVSFTAISQNYDCLQFGSKNYFINNQGYVRGIRIDSIRSVGTDIYYFPYRTQRISNYLSHTAIDTLGASWLGKNVIKQPDGTFLFDNMWDTVMIKTQAHTGDSWIFFNDTTQFFYTATVSSEDTMTVLGIVDSIKTITITADSAGFAHSTDPVNNFQIVLSKNHGFVQVFDLFTFPYHRPDTLSSLYPSGFHYIRWMDYYLDVLLNNLGTCDPGVCFDNPPDVNNSAFHLFPFHNPATMEIYNFSIGDVYESQFSAPGFSEFTVDQITGKIITPYSVAYSGVENKMDWTNPTYPGAPIVTYPPATFSFRGGDTSLLLPPQLMPEEWNAGYLLHYFPRQVIAHGCDSAASYVVDLDYRGSGFNSDGEAMVPSSYSHTYSLGFGMSDFNSYDSYSYLSQTQYYIYYLKNDSACGSPVDPIPAAITALSGPTNIYISPNPATNSFTVVSNTELGDNTVLSVYDMTGRLQLSLPVSGKNATLINTSAWMPGIYIINISNDNGPVEKEKLVILK